MQSRLPQAYCASLSLPEAFNISRQSNSSQRCLALIEIGTPHYTSPFNSRMNGMNGCWWFRHLMRPCLTLRGTCQGAWNTMALAMKTIPTASPKNDGSEKIRTSLHIWSYQDAICLLPSACCAHAQLWLMSVCGPGWWGSFGVYLSIYLSIYLHTCIHIYIYICI